MAGSSRRGVGQLVSDVHLRRDPARIVRNIRKHGAGSRGYVVRVEFPCNGVHTKVWSLGVRTSVQGTEVRTAPAGHGMRAHVVVLQASDELRVALSRVSPSSFGASEDTSMQCASDP